MKLVIIESPYAGDIETNLEYLAHCMRDSLARDEAPLAAHALYTQYLDDEDAAQREQGMLAGFAWGARAEARVFCTDLGMSGGMERGLAEAERLGQAIEYRTLNWKRPERPVKVRVTRAVVEVGDYLCSGCGSVIAQGMAAVEVPVGAGGVSYAHVACIDAAKSLAKKPHFPGGLR